MSVRALNLSVASIEDQKVRDGITNAVNLLKQIIGRKASTDDSISVDNVAFEFARRIGFMQEVVDDFLADQSSPGLENTDQRRARNIAAFGQFQAYAAEQMERLRSAEHGPRQFEREALVPESRRLSSLDLPS